MTEAIRLAVIDDHPLFREGVTRSLTELGGFEIVAEGGSKEDALRIADDELPDIMLMDISMPIKNGIEATKEIRAACQNTRVAILSMHHTSEYVQRAMQAGAHGYVLKDSAGSEVIAAIHALYEGKRYFSQKIVGM